MVDSFLNDVFIGNETNASYLKATHIAVTKNKGPEPFGAFYPEFAYRVSEHRRRLWDRRIVEPALERRRDSLFDHTVKLAGHLGVQSQ